MGPFIRWKFVVPITAVVVGLVVFFVFFFDPLASCVLEKVGSKINGAKVEVDGLRTKFFKGRVEIRRFQVANKNEPMQNIVDMGPLAFQMELSELISKRAVIDEAELSGLQFNTARKTSGALPARVAKKEEKSQEPGAAEKLAEKYKDRFKLNLDGIKGDAKSKIEFDPAKLQLTQKAEDLKETALDLPDQWDKSVQDLNAEARLQKAEEDLKSIKETPTKGTEAITAIPEALKKLKTLKEELDQLKNDVNEVKQTAADQLKEVKNAPALLAEAKKKDVDDLMSRFNLDFADPDRLVEGMIGPLVLSRFQTVFRYVEIARKHMPSQKEKESLPAKPRASGMDIDFPTPAAPPRFWLKHALLSGTFQDVSASGSLTHMTSDPTRVGQPFKMNMSGKKGPQAFTAAAIFDHVGDNSKDSVSLQADGLDIMKMAPGTAGFFSEGSGGVELAVSLLGDKNIGGQMTLSLHGLKFNDAALLTQVGAGGASKEDQLKTRFITDVARAIEKLPQVLVTAQIFGTYTDPGIKLSSNLNSTLVNVVKNSVGSLVQDQKRELEGRLDQVWKEKSADIQAKTAGLEEKLNGKFGGIEAKVQEKINEATGINLGSGEGSSSPIPGVKVPSLNKIFKK